MEAWCALDTVGSSHERILLAKLVLGSFKFSASMFGHMVSKTIFILCSIFFGGICSANKQYSIVF